MVFCNAMACVYDSFHHYSSRWRSGSTCTDTSIIHHPKTEWEKSPPLPQTLSKYRPSSPPSRGIKSDSCDTPSDQTFGHSILMINHYNCHMICMITVKGYSIRKGPSMVTIDHHTHECTIFHKNSPRVHTHRYRHYPTR